MNLIFCGLPKSGKTAIGKMVADKLHYPFIDTDRWIEEAYLQETGLSRSCRDIFRFEGEAAFRQREKEQISRLQPLEDHVIAIGGGSLSLPENREVLRSIGYLIYLQTSVDLLWERVSRNGIPAYLDANDPKKSFFALCEKRIPLYKQTAHDIIDTDGFSFHDIAERIISEDRRKKTEDRRFLSVE